MKQTIFDEIAQLIGAEAVTRLKEELGGKRILIPKTMNENHPIAAIIGLDLALQISQEFHSVLLDFPVLAAKRASILADLEKGDTPTRIAQRYFVSRRMVTKMKLAQTQKQLSEAQGHLF